MDLLPGGDEHNADHAPGPKGGKGLTKRIGPLPLWGWLVAGGIVVVGGLIVMRGRRAGAPVTIGGPIPGNGAASTGGGGTGGTGLTPAPGQNANPILASPTPDNFGDLLNRMNPGLATGPTTTRTAHPGLPLSSTITPGRDYSGTGRPSPLSGATGSVNGSAPPNPGQAAPVLTLPPPVSGIYESGVAPLYNNNLVYNVETGQPSGQFAYGGGGGIIGSVENATGNFYNTQGAPEAGPGLPYNPSFVYGGGGQPVGQFAYGPEGNIVGSYGFNGQFYNSSGEPADPYYGE